MTDSFALGDPGAWERLVTAANPASIVVVIASRMGPELRKRMSPDDILQEALLKAWQARAEFTWQGTPAFRKWLLRIAERCIEDQRDYAGAKKRNEFRTVQIGPTGGPSAAVIGTVDPWTSTTPSRIAREHEKAALMERALVSLPDEVRDVVRLRLFEELEIQEIAVRLGLGESAVRHRFRKGAERYRDELRNLMGPSSTGGV